MSTVDEELFRLLDVRGIGCVTSDQIQTFITEHTRQRVSAVDAAQVFALSQDRKGTVDRVAFPRLMRGIEAASRLSSSELLELHLDSLYKQLFHLVDEDEGGSLSRSEVRPLLDTIIQVFGVKTITDVGIVFRSVGVGMNDDILFPQFRAIVSRIVGSHPISQVIHAFREVKAKKKVAMERGTRLRALTGMLNSTAGGTTAEPSVLGSSFEADKDSIIKQLEERIRELENNHKPSRSTRGSNPLNDPDDADADRGVAVPIKPVTVSQSALIAFELDGDESAVDLGTLGRLAIQAACTDAMFRTILDVSSWSREASSLTQMSEGVVKSQSSVASSVDAALTQVRKGLLRTLSPEDRHNSSSSDDDEGVPSDGIAAKFTPDDDALCVVQTALHNFSAITAQVNDVQKQREDLSMAAAATAHVSSHRRRIAMGVIEFQQSSCAFISTVLALRTFLGDAEVTFLSASQRSEPVSREDRLMLINRGAELQSTFAAAFAAMSATLSGLCGSMAPFYTKTKDRACQANLATPASPLYADCASPSIRGALSPSDRHRSGSPSRSPFGVSRPPRSRARRTLERRGPERVDALVADHLIQRGVAVPPNFKRVVEGRVSHQPTTSSLASDPSSTHAVGTGPRSYYAFGLKKIELSALDDHTLCVHVGGGFLLFEEYCRAHTEFETIKWTHHTNGGTAHGRSATTDAQRGRSVSHQHRSGSPSTGATRSLFSS